MYTGMKTSTAPRGGKFYVEPVDILSGLVKFPITSIQITGSGSRLWNLGELLPCLIYPGVGISFKHTTSTTHIAT